MSPLLAPIFAQAISLQVGDRTEVRVTQYENTRMEGTTNPAATLSVTGRRQDLRLTYSPSFVLSPLDSTPRQLYVFHTMSVGVGYRLRRTSLQLTSSLSIGTINFRVLGPQAQPTTNRNQSGDTNGTGTPTTGTPTTGTPTTGTPTTGTPTTGTPTTGTPTPGTPTGSGNTPTTPNLGAGLQRPTKDRKVRYYASTTALGVTHQISKTVPMSASVGMTTAGGIGKVAGADYPTLRAWFVTGSTGYSFATSAKDSFFGGLGLTKSWSSTGDEAATLTGSGAWSHRLGKRTSASLSGGLGITRFSRASGLAGFSIFPTFQASLSHQTRLGRGVLSFAASAFSSPVLDPLRALVDPRVGVGGGIGYDYGRLSLGTSASSTVSVAPADNNAGSVNSSQAEAHAGYQLGDIGEIDTGVRVAHQTYQGAQVFPTTWGAFVGLSLGYNLVLAGGR
jgi:hypothetical protein